MNVNALDVHPFFFFIWSIFDLVNLLLKFIVKIAVLGNHLLASLSVSGQQLEIADFLVAVALELRRLSVVLPFLIVCSFLRSANHLLVHFPLRIDHLS